AILEKAPAPIRNLQPLAPPALDRTIEVCLAKDPDERWQSAGDLWKELRWIEAGGSQVTVRPDYPEPKALGSPGMQLLAVSSRGELAVLIHARYVWYRL